MDTKQIVISDLAIAPEEGGGEIVVDYGMNAERQLWISLENEDGEFTAFLSREQWEELRNAFDKAFQTGI